MTSLAMAQNQRARWSIEEMQWRDIPQQARLSVRGLVSRLGPGSGLKSPDGRVVEATVEPDARSGRASGMVEVTMAVIAKVRLAWFAGPPPG